MRKLINQFSNLHAKVIVTAGLFLVAGGDVYAQAAQNAVQSGINFANLIAKLLVALFALGGLGAVGRGAFLFIKKGGERGDDIEWSKIGFLMVGGTLAMVIGWFAFGLVEAVGGSANDVGRTVQVGRP